MFDRLKDTGGSRDTGTHGYTDHTDRPHNMSQASLTTNPTPKRAHAQPRVEKHDCYTVRLSCNVVYPAFLHSIRELQYLHNVLLEFESE